MKPIKAMVALSCRIITAVLNALNGSAVTEMHLFQERFFITTALHYVANILLCTMGDECVGL